MPHAVLPLTTMSRTDLAAVATAGSGAAMLSKSQSEEFGKGTQNQDDTPDFQACFEAEPDFIDHAENRPSEPLPLNRPDLLQRAEAEAEPRDSSDSLIEAPQMGRDTNPAIRSVEAIHHDEKGQLNSADAPDEDWPVATDTVILPRPVAVSREAGSGSIGEFLQAVANGPEISQPSQTLWPGETAVSPRVSMASAGPPAVSSTTQSEHVDSLPQQAVTSGRYEPGRAFTANIAPEPSAEGRPGFSSMLPQPMDPEPDQASPPAADFTGGKRVWQVSNNISNLSEPELRVPSSGTDHSLSARDKGQEVTGALPDRPAETESLLSPKRSAPISDRPVQRQAESVALVGEEPQTPHKTVSDRYNPAKPSDTYMSVGALADPPRSGVSQPPKAVDVSVVISDPLSGGIHVQTNRVSDGPPLLQAPDLARQIAQKTMAASIQPGQGPVDIELNPAQLGRVRISMTMADGTMMMNVDAERPEVLELMRRHIDQLAQEFRQIGYGTISFSFGQSDQRHQNEQIIPEPAKDLAPSEIAAGQPRQWPTARGSTGLDIRI